jgi:acylphosphatase
MEVGLALEVRAYGRVQGVGFRYWAKRRAEELGVCGWIRNRRDGTVEALLDGPAEAVERMLEALREGPPGARVERLETTETADLAAGPGFEQRPTG